MALILALTLAGLALAILPTDRGEDRRYLQLSELARQAAVIDSSLAEIERESGRWAQTRDPGALGGLRLGLSVLRREVAQLRIAAAGLSSMPKLREMGNMLPDDGSLRWPDGAPAGDFAGMTGLGPMALALQREAEAELLDLLDQERDLRMAAAALPGLLGITLLTGLWFVQRRRARDSQAVQGAERKAIQESTRVGAALVGPDLRLLGCDAMLARMMGRPQAAIRNIRLDEAMPGFAESLTPLLRRALAGEEALGSRALNGVSPDGRHLHWTISMQPVRDEAGKVTAVCLAAVDMTARMEAEAAHLRTAHELNHRVKNTLATVQSLAAQTLRISGDDPPRFRQQFAARLQGVARSHDLLTAAGWGAVLLGATVRVGLSGQIGAAVVIEQDDEVWLRPAQVQAMLLAMQELADNAQRHGALTRPGGRIHVGWYRCPDGTARFFWRESHAGGRRIPLAPPQRSQEGFGMRLLRRALPQDLGAAAVVTVDFADEGLRAAFTFRPAEPGESFAAPNEAPTLG